MNRLKELRKDKKLTLQQVSKETGVSVASLSSYENGNRNPKIETWQKLADYFDVTVGYLQGGTDEKITIKEARALLNTSAKRFDDARKLAKKSIDEKNIDAETLQKIVDELQEASNEMEKATELLKTNFNN